MKTPLAGLNLQRFLLAAASLAGLIAAGIGIFLTLQWGKTLDAVAVGLLTLLIRELGGGKAAAFAWFFDGAADKPPPPLGTSSIVTSAPVVPDDSPTGKPGDPVNVKEAAPA